MTKVSCVVPTPKVRAPLQPVLAARADLKDRWNNCGYRAIGRTKRVEVLQFTPEIGNGGVHVLAENPA